MKIVRSFEPGDRCRYDFDLCSCARGRAQVDTAQDASWFGTWAPPAERTILNFAEGDVTRTICDTDEEFAAALRAIDCWNRDHSYGPARIDPGFDPALKAAFEAVGLGDVLLWGRVNSAPKRPWQDSRSVLPLQS